MGRYSKTYWSSVWVIMAVLVLSACGPPMAWYQAGTSQVQRDQDKSTCRARAYIAAGPPPAYASTYTYTPPRKTSSDFSDQRNIYEGLGDGIASAGHSLGDYYAYQGFIDNYERLCMEYLGYEWVEESEAYAPQ